MVAFVADVPVRWSDMDVYGHVNHARTTLDAYDAAAQRPRRFTQQEREFLAIFRSEEDGYGG